jgi:chaperonin GroEL
MKQKKQMLQDSLNSTRAAIEGGIVVGGGVALLRASLAVKQQLKLEGGEAVGAACAFTACLAPFKQIVANSNLESAVVLNQILEQKETVGFNAQNEKIEDLLKAGIIDPLKIVNNGLKYASSAATVVLLSEVLIGNAPEE